MQILTGIVALLTTEINYFHAKCYVKHPHQISDLTLSLNPKLLI